MDSADRLECERWQAVGGAVERIEREFGERTDAVKAEIDKITTGLTTFYDDLTGDEGIYGKAKTTIVEALPGLLGSLASNLLPGKGAVQLVNGLAGMCSDIGGLIERTGAAFQEARSGQGAGSVQKTIFGVLSNLVGPVLQLAVNVTGLTGVKKAATAFVQSIPKTVKDGVVNAAKTIGSTIGDLIQKLFGSDILPKRWGPKNKLYARVDKNRKLHIGWNPEKKWTLFLAVLDNYNSTAGKPCRQRAVELFNRPPTALDNLIDNVADALEEGSAPLAESARKKLEDAVDLLLALLEQEGCYPGGDCPDVDKNSDSSELGKNLEAGNGGPKDKSRQQVSTTNVQAHHIVEGGRQGLDAEDNRSILFEVCININDAVNGVFLPNSCKPPDDNPDKRTYHNHTQVVPEYTAWVNKQLAPARGSKERVTSTLLAMRGSLIRGEAPWLASIPDRKDLDPWAQCPDLD